jgi:hypothetical protein
MKENFNNVGKEISTLNRFSFSNKLTFFFLSFFNLFQPFFLPFLFSFLSLSSFFPFYFLFFFFLSFLFFSFRVHAPAFFLSSGGHDSLYEAPLDGGYFGVGGDEPDYDASTMPGAMDTASSLPGAVDGPRYDQAKFVGGQSRSRQPTLNLAMYDTASDADDAAYAMASASRDNTYERANGGRHIETAYEMASES